MRRTQLITGVTALLAAVLVSACQDAATTSPEATVGSVETAVAPTDMMLSSVSGEATIEDLASAMDALNVQLAAAGVDYRVAMAEAITNAESGEVGITVLAKNVGNKQLSFDFVPGDARRAWSGAGGDAITYAIDQSGDAVPPFGGLTAAQTTTAIEQGHASWEALTCSNLGQSRNPDFGLDIGVVAFQLSGGTVGGPFVFADVQHAGWRDLNFATGILGVTYTFGFTDANGFTDVDNNGKLDAAFREIYYDPSYSWANTGAANVDVQSIAVHEIGHGLSQGHFGTVAYKNNGRLQRSPFAVMNAIYSQPLQVLQGTDNGGHCSNWGQWPNN